MQGAFELFMIALSRQNISKSCSQLGDVASFIVDKEIEILDGLHSMLNECGPALLTTHAACTQLDW